MSGQLAYFQDQNTALTGSFVTYPFGLLAGYLRIDNDETSGTNTVVWSFDGGTTVHGKVIPGKYVEIQNSGVGAISLKFLNGAPAYRLHAMQAQ